MPCKKCSDGVWQCSVSDDPCQFTMEAHGGVMQMQADNGGSEAAATAAGDPIETTKECFKVFTKKTGAGCKMLVVSSGSPDPSGWDPAGSICMTFDLHSDATTGQCFVRVTQTA